MSEITNNILEEIKANRTPEEEDADEASFRDILANDWAVFGRWDRLHAPISYDVDTWEWCAKDLTTACGRRVERAYIPGIFTRMGAQRCAHCCDKVGLPRGKGSPKNDQQCRIILGIPCLNIQRDYEGEFPLPLCRLPTGHEGDHRYERSHR